MKCNDLVCFEVRTESGAQTALSLERTHSKLLSNRSREDFFAEESLSAENSVQHDFASARYSIRFAETITPVPDSISVKELGERVWRRRKTETNKFTFKRSQRSTLMQQHESSMSHTSIFGKIRCLYTETCSTKFTVAASVHFRGTQHNYDNSTILRQETSCE